MQENKTIYVKTLELLNSIPNLRTKDIKDIIKKYYKENTDISSFELNKYGAIDNIYLAVNLKRCKDFKEQLAFIETMFPYFKDWWYIDILLQYFKRPIDFDLVYEKAKNYVNSSLPYERRFGYVVFLAGLINEDTFDKICSLLKDDDVHHVVIGEAWLISELAIKYPEKAYNFLVKSELKYNILGLGIQKICDSFRVTNEYKEIVKALRPIKKDRK